jgi:hypothetical protein
VIVGGNGMCNQESDELIIAQIIKQFYADVMMFLDSSIGQSYILVRERERERERKKLVAFNGKMTLVISWLEIIN